METMTLVNIQMSLRKRKIFLRMTSLHQCHLTQLNLLKTSKLMCSSSEIHNNSWHINLNHFHSCLKYPHQNSGPQTIVAVYCSKWTRPTWWWDLHINNKTNNSSNTTDNIDNLFSVVTEYAMTDICVTWALALFEAIRKGKVDNKFTLWKWFLLKVINFDWS